MIRNEWTKHDIAILKRYYPTRSNQLADLLEKPHTAFAIRQQACKLGLRLTPETRRRIAREHNRKGDGWAPTPEEIAARAAEIRAQWYTADARCEPSPCVPYRVYRVRI